MPTAIRHSFTIRHFVAAAVSAAVGVAFTPNANADTSWVGPRFSTDPAAWNNAENWDGGVPTGSTTAIVTYNSNKSYGLFFTPPLDFTGKISVSRDTTTWDILMPNYLKLTVLDGATWTVSGGGHLIATDGIADRIASTFYGTIVIPPSASFTAPATLHTDVEFTGKGTLTLTTTNQLSHISGFSGTLVWNGPEGASLTPVDIAVLQQHGIRLGNGASINLRDRFLSINGVHKIPDWNDAASDWSFNGTNTASAVSSFNLDANPPHANAAGELELVNDAGQVHSVFYKGFRLKMHDSWGVSFRWTPGDDLPRKYIDAGKHQEWSGMFGFYMVPEPTTYGTLWQPGGNGHGFAMDFLYSRAGWQRNRENISGGSVSVTPEMLNAIGEGFDFHEAADVDITCQNGTVTVTMTQGDKMFSVQRPTFNQADTLALIPDGYYIGFAASSAHQESGSVEPLVTHTISDFRGWYRAREAHGWQNVADSVYPFTSANCTARIYTDASTYVENAAALESDGSFRLEPYGSKTRNILRANYNFDRTKRYLVQFDLVAGTGTSAENTEFTKMGFVRCNETTTLNSWVFGYDAINQKRWDGYAYPIMLTTYWWKGESFFWSNGATDSTRGTIEESQAFTTPKMVKSTTTHVGFLYDGLAGVYYQAHSGKHSMDIGWIPSEFIQTEWTYFPAYPVRFQISHGINPNAGNVDTVLKNFSIKRLDSPDTSFIDGEIAVAPNATATLRADASAASSPVAAAQVRKVSLAAGSALAVATDVAGSRVGIDSVAVSGDGAGISSTAATTLGGSIEFTGDVPATGATFSGDVTFASGTAEIVVPESWKDVNGIVPLFSLASTTSGTLPSGYRIVTDAGEDLTDKARVSVFGNAVRVCFKSPTVMFVR